MILTTKGERDAGGNIIAPPTSEDSLKANILTAVYSAVVMLFGTLYKMLAVEQTKEENHKYWKQYDDALVKRLFLFNSLNFYFPLLFVAFDPRNAANYDDLFSLLMSQLAYKQVGMNLAEYFIPIMRYERPITDLRCKFSATLN